MDVNWLQLSLTIGGMVAVGGIAWGTMRAQLSATKETLAMFTDIFAKQLEALKTDTQRERELCESRCVGYIRNGKESTRDAHTRLDTHIERHPGPSAAIGGGG